MKLKNIASALAEESLKVQDKVLMSILIILIVIIFISYLFIIRESIKEFFESLASSKREKKRKKIMNAIEDKTSPIIRDLKEFYLREDKIEKSLQDIPCLFFGKDKKFVEGAISLIYEMIDDFIVPLDTKSFIKSIGLDENYDDYIKRAFNNEGFNPYYLKDSVTFYNIVEYWKNYVKVVKNLEDKSEDVNTKLLKDLYEETKNLFDRVVEIEEREKKKVLKTEIKEAVDGLEKLSRINS